MKIEEIMTKSVVTIEMDDSLREVKAIFDHANFHHLLVTENGCLRGVLSDRDLLRSMSPYVGTMSETNRDSATLDKKVHQVMTRKPIVVKPNDNVAEAIDVFNMLKVSCIPVVDDDLHPIGIVSWRDIFKTISQKHLFPRE